MRLGITEWLAAAAHEIRQEMGDFGILIHGGWRRSRALLFNFLSALTFLVGALVAYAASGQMDVTFLVPFAAGNCVYIGAVGLVPEVKSECTDKIPMVHTLAIVAGLALLFVLAMI